MPSPLAVRFATWRSLPRNSKYILRLGEPLTFQIFTDGEQWDLALGSTENRWDQYERRTEVRKWRREFSTQTIKEVFFAGAIYNDDNGEPNLPPAYNPSDDITPAQPPIPPGGQQLPTHRSIASRSGTATVPGVVPPPTSIEVTTSNSLSINGSTIEASYGDPLKTKYKWLHDGTTWVVMPGYPETSSGSSSGSISDDASYRIAGTDASAAVAPAFADVTAPAGVTAFSEGDDLTRTLSPSGDVQYWSADATGTMQLISTTTRLSGVNLGEANDAQMAAIVTAGTAKDGDWVSNPLIGGLRYNFKAGAFAPERILPGEYTGAQLATIRDSGQSIPAGIKAWHASEGSGDESGDYEYIGAPVNDFILVTNAPAADGNETLEGSGNVVDFANWGGKTYGEVTPVTGTVTLNTAGAERGSTITMYYAGRFTLNPNGADVRTFGTTSDALNKIVFESLGGNRVSVSISVESSAIDSGGAQVANFNNEVYFDGTELNQVRPLYESLGNAVVDWSTLSWNPPVPIAISHDGNGNVTNGNNIPNAVLGSGIAANYTVQLNGQSETRDVIFKVGTVPEPPPVLQSAVYNVASLAPGVTADGAADDTAALQAWIDGLVAGEKDTGYLNGGTYRITSPLWLTGTASKDTPGFYPIRIQGAGASTGGATRFATIDASAIVDQPALIIQSARYADISGIKIKGPNLAPAAMGVSGPFSDESQYLTAGVADNRHSPQCAIAIDPALAADPGGGYPGMDYQSSPSGSNEVRLRDLAIYDHNIGIMSRPDGGSVQGDQVTLSQIDFQGVKTAYAGGNNQMRISNEWDNIKIAFAHTGFDTRSYGAQEGKLAVIDGLQFGQCYRMFNNHGATGVDVRGIHSEDCGTIGILCSAVSPVPHPIKISGSRIRLNQAGPNAAPFVATSYAPTIFSGVIFQTDQHVNFEGENIHFDSCAYSSDNGAIRSIADSDTAGQTTASVFTNCLRSEDALPNTPLGTRMEWDNMVPANDRRVEPHRSTLSIRTREHGEFEYISGDVRGVYTDAAATGISITGSTLTFSTTRPDIYFVGDYLMAELAPIDAVVSATRAPGFRVTGIAGSVVSAEALCDPDRITVPTGIWILKHEWAPLADIYGTISSAGTPGQVSITSLTVPPSDYLKPGDWLNGYGTNATSRVLAVNDGAGTVDVTNISGGIVGRVMHLHFGIVRRCQGSLPDVLTTNDRNIDFDAGFSDTKYLDLTSNLSNYRLYSEREGEFHLIIRAAAAQTLTWNAVVLGNPPTAFANPTGDRLRFINNGTNFIYSPNA